MPVHFKKAADVSSKALKQAGARAVSKEEVHLATPARESTKVTMMPWRGWVGRLISDTFGEERYRQIRKMFFYLPDDEFDLMQQPYAATKIPISEKDPNMTAYFRYPSPGSRDAVRIPKHFGSGEGEDPYNTAFYTRDTARRYARGLVGPEVAELKLSLVEDSPEKEEFLKKLEAGPVSSQGNKGRFATGPSDFDPSGLRATMSATHKALNESLDSHMPDHVSLRSRKFVSPTFAFSFIHVLPNSFCLVSFFLLQSINKIKMCKQKKSCLYRIGGITPMSFLSGTKSAVYQVRLVYQDMDGSRKKIAWPHGKKQKSKAKRKTKHFYFWPRVMRNFRFLVCMCGSE